MAYPYDGMFYPTLPQDTQDFPAVLSGVGRSLREIGRSTQYLPYDVLGAPVDLATLVARPFGYQTQTPVGGSDWLIDLARQYGIADKPTGSGTETLTRLAVGIPSPVAVPRAIGAFAQGLERASDITTEQANRAADALVRQITGNPQATAPQVLQETAMPFMQAVAPRPSGLLETPVKSDLGFYSALEQATIPLQNKGTGSQFLAQIEKTAGVKPEEVKWTGLDEFLKSRQNVTKQEVQDYLAANRVDLQEVRLKDPDPEDVRLFMEDEAGQGFDYEDALDFLRSTEPGPKFSSYTLPGGENYREILLTLPEGSKSPAYQASKNLADAEKAYDLDQSYENYQRVLEARKAADSVGADWKSPEFRSSHFDQPNILAHMRVNDRVVDGKKGYDTPQARAAEQQKLDNILAERQSLLDEQRRLEELALPYTSQGKDAPSDIVDRWSVVSNRINNLQTEQNRLGRTFGQGVPDAPFKTTWHELTLKRAIQEASEKGYDRIAFTTGKTQAERYDLSKQIGQITARPTPDGKIALEALTPDMREQVISKVVMENELDDIVGKEIADKIRTQVEYPKNFDDRGKSVELSGLDLQVGGEGMKGFYDQILPKSLEKLGKKFDAKVGKTEMDGVEVWQMDITPKMRESVLTKGQPLFAATPALPALGLLGSEEE